VEGKATQRQKKKEEADRKWVKEMSDKPPTTKNGGQGKTSHQLMNNYTPPPKKTWADVIKGGGINVQIVLRNGNLGLTSPTNRRGERQGGVAWWLGKRNAVGLRGVMGRGNDGVEITPCGGNKGRKLEKDGRERVEDRWEPSAVASVQVGHLDQMTRDGL
jgi:hypothetical protein